MYECIVHVRVAKVEEIQDNLLTKCRFLPTGKCYNHAYFHLVLKQSKYWSFLNV